MRKLPCSPCHRGHPRPMSHPQNGACHLAHEPAPAPPQISVTTPACCPFQETPPGSTPPAIHQMTLPCDLEYQLADIGSTHQHARQNCQTSARAVLLESHNLRILYLGEARGAALAVTRVRATPQERWTPGNSIFRKLLTTASIQIDGVSTDAMHPMLHAAHLVQPWTCRGWPVAMPVAFKGTKACSQGCHLHGSLFLAALMAGRHRVSCSLCCAGSQLCSMITRIRPAGP